MFLDKCQQLRLKGRLLHNVNLKDYTTWRVGGPVSTLYMPKGIEDLKIFLKMISKDEPITWLGMGSNVLVRDLGLLGVVIVARNCMDRLFQENETILCAEAGVASARFGNYVAELGLTGMEFMCGIPGTIGGALAMNAGSYGMQTWDYVTKVETIDRFGQLHIRDVGEHQVLYRSVSQFPDEWFVAAHFCMEYGDKEKINSKICEMLSKRRASQPVNYPNAGSVFRNPPGNYAAKLIDESGLKGRRIGGACVSSKHANFIVNDRNATAEDIESLIELIQDVVESKYGIRLECEVKIIGGRGLR